MGAAALERFRPGPYHWKGWAAGGAGAALVLGWISRTHYLLFHSLVELFTVVVGACLFLIAWHARNRIENGYLLFVGMAYFWISLIDLVHVLAYPGVGVLPGGSTNLAAQLWIAGRATEASALVGGAFALGRRPRPVRVFAAYGVTASILLALIAEGGFPVCFVEGSGLTRFKIWAEYLISLALAGTIWILWGKADRFRSVPLRLVLVSIGLTILSELSFTLYVSAFGLSNLVGHFLKFASFFLIYLALVRTAIEEPVEVLFVELKRREEELCQERDRLQEALSRVRTLEGLIPICSECKRIRDDDGYWQEVEAYVRTRTPAEFTHGLCPECARRLYPELFEDGEPGAGRDPGGDPSEDAGT